MKRYIPNEYLSLTSFLQNEWTFNQNLMDSIGFSPFYNPINISFTTDRLGKENSAIYLNSGYLEIPTGIKLNESFTITTWIKPLSNSQVLFSLTDGIN